MDSNTLLDDLNRDYLKVHTEYENLYWKTYMGNNSFSQAFQDANTQFNNFRCDKSRTQMVRETIQSETDQILKERLSHWEKFFHLYQIPENLIALREKIIALENNIRIKRAEMKTGYHHPKTGEWHEVPENQLTLMIATEPDEAIRKACFLGKELAAKVVISEYIELVGLRNQYAHGLGFRDFYHYKARIEEQMESNEIFTIFDELCEKIRPFCFQRIDEMEKNIPNVRAPWNFRYLLSGDFARAEDKYFPLETILDAWGQSFSALGINYQDGIIRLDLLERKQKYNNGFCHMPIPVHYEDGMCIPGEVNFTCNAIINQIGSGYNAGVTLFHEGGHAAHFLNMDQQDICLNTEYPPMGASWAETQSMFLDTLFSSIEWKTRYAKSLEGESYPFSLHEEKLKKTFLLEPMGMLRMASVIDFEKQVYAAKNLDVQTVEQIAQNVSLKYNHFNTPSLYILTFPHIYGWSSSCAYHGYALATLALTQWREYLDTKYGYLVDNPEIGKEMSRVWNFGSSKSFGELVEIATGKPLSPQAYVHHITLGEEELLRASRERVAHMDTIAQQSREPDLKAQIIVVDGEQTIATNQDGFDSLCTQFRRYIESIKERDQAPESM